MSDLALARRVISGDESAGEEFFAEYFHDSTALEGSARGLEVMIERRSATGISGWIGYSYGVAHYVDRERQETFAGERDQRHAVNVVASAPIAWKARTTVTFCAGSNVPIPGYFTEGDAAFLRASVVIRSGFRRMHGWIFASSVPYLL
jgi:hypothetical protein